MHCDGTQLRLVDSDIGSDQYTSHDYYVWTAGSGNTQMLFIFPTRVRLTIITLHYYSDSIRGLPGLKVWAVPDDFDVWNAPISIYYHVDVATVPPGGEPRGLKNIRVNFTTNTMKILLYKSAASFTFAVSEVEFYNTCMNTESATDLAVVYSHPSTTPYIKSITTTKFKSNNTREC